MSNFSVLAFQNDSSQHFFKLKHFKLVKYKLLKYILMCKNMMQFPMVTNLCYGIFYAQGVFVPSFMFTIQKNEVVLEFEGLYILRI